MGDVESAVEDFLNECDRALEEYEAGYADADATLTLLESHIEDLRSTVE